MSAGLYWVESRQTGRLAIAARPRAGDWLEDEMKAWRRQGVDTVISLLQASEVAELGLQLEPEYCADCGMDFFSFPIEDRNVPASRGDTSRIVGGIVDGLGLGRSIVVHCRAGIGRSALIAACALGRLGFDIDAAFSLIGEARGVVVPDTDSQRDWAREFCRHCA